MLNVPDSHAPAMVESGIPDSPATRTSKATGPLPSTKPRSRLAALGLWRIHTAAWFAASFLVLSIAIFVGHAEASTLAELLLLTGLALFCLASVIALGRGIAGLVGLMRPSRTRSAPETGGAIVAVVGNLLMAGFGAFVAYLATFAFSRGRQLRRFGRVLLPTLRPNGAWTTATMMLEASENLPEGLADQWRENGKTEHASVAAFARLTLDLMALGAPPVLITSSNQDALDEIRHAEICFSLARALDGKSVSPSPFPQAQRVASLPRSRILALAQLAVDSLVDGALHEGVSARIIAKLAQRCEVAGIRTALKEIAADEGRHAAHGWAVVGWCLEEGGRPVAEALLGALRMLPDGMRSDLPEGASVGGWERWGIHGHRLEAEEYVSARAQVVRRVHDMVIAMSSRAA
jgi:hypothetical protein